jgi:hypothetical protein
MTIKKLLTLIILCSLQPAFSQVVLSTHNLEMKKSGIYHDAMAAPEAKDRGLVVFAADKENVTALRYTRVLYYADSLAAPRPGVNDYDMMAGYSYDENQRPSAYWANVDFTKILEQRFDFDAADVTDYAFDMTYKDESIVITFSDNNSFYIITKSNKGSKLYVYVFNGGKYLKHPLDFSGFTIKNDKDKAVTLSGLLEQYGLQKMESPDFNPLAVTAEKIKLYLNEDAMQLTLDVNPGFTQVFTINSSNYSISELIVPQKVLEKGNSNSFIHSKKLYQVVLDKKELSLTATDLTSGSELNTYRVGADATITFKNSDLLEQTDNKTGKVYKNTKKFLRKAAWGLPAVTVYKTPEDFLVVTGAIRQSVPAGEVVLGSVATVAMVATGTGVDGFGMFNDHIQSIYFESLFDEGFNHKPLPQQRLASDYLGQYMYEHRKEIAKQTIFSYDYYMVLGYYDVKAEKYVLVKFQDDSLR